MKCEPNHPTRVPTAKNRGEWVAIVALLGAFSVSAYSAVAKPSIQALFERAFGEYELREGSGPACAEGALEPMPGMTNSYRLGIRIKVLHVDEGLQSEKQADGCIVTTKTESTITVGGATVVTRTGSGCGPEFTDPGEEERFTITDKVLIYHDGDSHCVYRRKRAAPAKRNR